MTIRVAILSRSPARFVPEHRSGKCTYNSRFARTRLEHLTPKERRSMSDVATKGSTAGTKGLEGIIAANSDVCFIDGKEGRLLYQGYNIHELADKSTFEEVC